MTESGARIQSLVDAFDEHFKYNKKCPNLLKVQAWLVLNIGTLKRHEWRKADSAVTKRLLARWPNAGNKS
jgi:hypothetical protein